MNLGPSDTQATRFVQMRHSICTTLDLAPACDRTKAATANIALVIELFTQIKRNQFFFLGIARQKLLWKIRYSFLCFNLFFDSWKKILSLIQHWTLPPHCVHGTRESLISLLLGFFFTILFETLRVSARHLSANYTINSTLFTETQMKLEWCFENGFMFWHFMKAVTSLKDSAFCWLFMAVLFSHCPHQYSLNKHIADFRS